MLRSLTKIFKGIYFKVAFFYSWILTYLKFKLNGVDFSSDFKARGVPIVNVNLKGSFKIGRNFKFHSGKLYNMIGRQQQCYFIVGRDSELIIGDNVGVSSLAIVCHEKISIGNNVRIGGGVVIYDTDFHSLDTKERTELSREFKENVKTVPVVIEDGVFIGAHAIILKGVTIGRNSIIGAGSVVTKSIPDNELWGGNPAKFIRTIN